MSSATLSSSPSSTSDFSSNFSSDSSSSNFCSVCWGVKKTAQKSDWCRHFGTSSVCFSCALFFSRSIDRNYKCKKAELCKLFKDAAQLVGTPKHKKARTACRSCRLQKCYQIGMRTEYSRKSWIKYLTKDDDKEYGVPQPMDYQKYDKNDMEFANCNETGQQNTTPNDFEIVLIPVDKRQKLWAEAMDTITRLNSAQNRIWHSVRHSQGSLFSLELMNRHYPSLQYLLNSGKDIMDITIRTTVPMFPIQELSEHSEAQFTPILLGIVEFCRVLPVFELLEMDDRICLLSYVCLANFMLFILYSSSMYNSAVVLTPNGKYSMLQIQECINYKKDAKVVELANYLFHNCMDPFNRANLVNEEMLLLYAIILTHSASPGLSTYANKLLQNESERIAQILMHLEQLRHGQSRGAQRYAQIIQLAETVFIGAKKFRQLTKRKAMTVYLERYEDCYPHVCRPFMAM